MKLYVVRGIGFNADDVWLSNKFEVTMLREDSCMDGSWFSCLDWESSSFHGDYLSFRDGTGVVLDPGEYTTVTVTV